MLKRKKQITNIVSKKTAKIRVGDNVIVITGADKKKTGQVIELSKDKNFIKITGIKLQTHYEKNDGSRQTAGLNLKEGWVDISNVAQMTEDGKPTKVKILIEDSKKKLISKKTNKEIMKQSVKAKVQIENREERKEKEELEKEKFAAKNKKKEGVIRKKDKENEK